MARGISAAENGKLYPAIDDRFVSSNWLRRTLNKVYPDHWSFLLGQIAVSSFIVFLAGGTSEDRTHRRTRNGQLRDRARLQRAL